MTQADFATTLGTNVSYVKAVETLAFAPNFTVMRAWKRKFRVSYDWIIEG